MKIVKTVQPPAGVSRALFRAPIHLYRLGLGWLFGNRILLLNHIGRVSRKQRQVILEVVEHDRTDDSFVVASGWGPGAAWYRNVRHTPDVSIRVGTRAIPVTAVPLTEDEGADVFARYFSRPRTAAKYLLHTAAKYVLPYVLGFSVDGSEADFRAVGRRIPFVRLVPRQ